MHSTCQPLCRFCKCQYAVGFRVRLLWRVMNPSALLFFNVLHLLFDEGFAGRTGGLPEFLRAGTSANSLGHLTSYRLTGRSC